MASHLAVMGFTTAVHSQLSAFHMMDRRFQEGSRASTSDAIILYNVEKTKPLLSVAMSGVLATRWRSPGACIERIWIKRATPFTLHNGKRVMRNPILDLADYLLRAGRGAEVGLFQCL